MKPLLQMPYSRTSVCAYRFLLHRFLDFYYQIVPRACNPLKTFALVYCLGLTVLDGDFGVTFARYNRVRDEYVIPKQTHCRNNISRVRHASPRAHFKPPEFSIGYLLQSCSHCLPALRTISNGSATSYTVFRTISNFVDNIFDKFLNK